MTKNNLNIPKVLLAPSLDHLLKMTDNTGILEHCFFTIPDKRQGYTVDDNARALQVALRLNKKIKDKLINIYFQFLLSACGEEGFYNDLEPNLIWKDQPGTGEWFGRAMLALSDVALLGNDNLKLAAIDIYDHYAPFIDQAGSLRTTANLVISLVQRIKFDVMYHHLYKNILFKNRSMAKEYPIKASYYHSLLVQSTQKLIYEFKNNSSLDWFWFEDTLIYDNAILPQALFYAYAQTQDKNYLKIAEQSLKFLISATFNKKLDCFSFPGSKGWYHRAGSKNIFDQQPLEAGVTTQACCLAYKITHKPEYLSFAIKAFDWYEGRNILKVQLIDEQSGGIRDGLEPWGFNPNQGAESILTYLKAYFDFKELIGTNISNISNKKPKLPPSILL